MRNEDSKHVRNFLRIGLLASGLMTAFAISSCQNPANQPSNDTISAVSSDAADCRTIEHKMGETTICGQPQRIVVLGPSVLESLLALTVQPVGYADHIAFHQGDYTDPSMQISYLGSYITQPLMNVGTAGIPSIEAILKVQPDLILGASRRNADQYEVLSEIAPTLLLKAPYFEPEESLRTLAQAVNRTEHAEQLLVQTQQQIAAAREAFASLVATHPQVLLLSSFKLQNLELLGAVGLCGSLIEALGFELVFPVGIDSDNLNSPMFISLETLPQLNDADLVILFGYNFSDLKQLHGMEHFEEHQLSKLQQAWETNAIAQSLAASKAGRVYFLPGYLCGALPGPIGTELYLKELKEQLLSSN